MQRRAGGKQEKENKSAEEAQRQDPETPRGAKEEDSCNTVQKSETPFGGFLFALCPGCIEPVALWKMVPAAGTLSGGIAVPAPRARSQC